MRTLIAALALLILTATAHAQECTTRAGYWIAASEKLFDMVTQADADGDGALVAKIVRSKLAGITKDGARVYLVDRSFTKATVRVPGSMNELVTNREAVDCR